MLCTMFFTLLFPGAPRDSELFFALVSADGFAPLPAGGFALFSAVGFALYLLHLVPASCPSRRPHSELLLLRAAFSPSAHCAADG